MWMIPGVTLTVKTVPVLESLQLSAGWEVRKSLVRTQASVRKSPGPWGGHISLEHFVEGWWTGEPDSLEYKVRNRTLSGIGKERLVWKINVWGWRKSLVLSGKYRMMGIVMEDWCVSMYFPGIFIFKENFITLLRYSYLSVRKTENKYPSPHNPLVPGNTFWFNTL